MMTDHEHVCEFKISNDLPEYPGADCECGETITLGDVHQRLNEHAKLKRENELIFKLLLPDTALWLRSKLDALKEGE